MKERETQARLLRSVQLGEFTLLNHEKLGRVMDLLEGVTQPNAEESRLLQEAKDLPEENAILGLYDRLGGAIKLGDRKVQNGTFYDFLARSIKESTSLGEEHFEDEFVLVKKQVPKKKDYSDLDKRLQDFSKKSVVEPEKPKKPAKPAKPEKPVKPKKPTKKEE